MSTKMNLLRVGALSALLLAAASAAPQEVKIERFRTPVTWYNCKTGEKITDARTWTPRSGKVRSDGFVEVLRDDGQPSTYCVKDFVVVTEQKIPVKDECGTVAARQPGATRGLGEGCKDTKLRK